MLLGLVLCPLKQRTITARHGLGRAVKTLSNASHIHPKRTNAGIKKFLEWIPIVSSFYNFPIPAPLFIHMVHMKANMIFQWATKNWCFWIVMLEKTLDGKEIQPVHPEGDQSWVFTGRTDAEAETPILWSPHAKNWLIGKDSDARSDWGQEEKGTIEDEMVWWHHWLNGHESE